MALTREQVEHVAYLARLGLSEAEKDRLTEQLSGILEHVERLNQVDTDHISPTAMVIPLENVMRDDEARPSRSLEDVLANAPRREGAFFRVRAILEQS